VYTARLDSVAFLYRALMTWGGNRKQLCFQAWKQWAALKQGRKASVSHRNAAPGSICSCHRQ